MEARRASYLEVRCRRAGPGASRGYTAPVLSRLAPFAFATVLFGCGDGEEGAGSPPVRFAADDSFVTLAAGTLELGRGGTVLLRLAPRDFVLATVDVFEPNKSYDPYPILIEDGASLPPAGLTFHPATSIRSRGVSGDHWALELRHSGGLVSQMTITRMADRFVTHWVPLPSTRPVVMLSVGGEPSASEGFYGLGEVFDDVNHRGKVRAMQLELTDLESANNEAHVPVPLLLGTSGWGLFVESPYPAAFDVAASDPARIAATFGTADASEMGLRFHLFTADHPLDLTRSYFDVTGYPRLPGPWALGPWIWRDENDDQAQVENDLETIRALDLATTAYWIDRPYATAVNTFDYLPSQFPDPDAMMAKMEALGFRTALWHTPYLDEKHAATQQLREHAESQGFYPPSTGLLLNGWGKPIDLTNPEAKAWWQSLVKQYVDRGVSGFKLDYGEDILAGAFGSGSGWKFSDGSTERTQHSQFQLHYHSTYAELLEDEDNFLLCRGGTYGGQRYASVIWPGDLDASFARHGEAIDDASGKYKAVGGLPASLVAALSLGPSGYPFYGSDTGGYRHSPPDKEVFIRWFQQTALSTVMQIGTSTNDVAWEPTAKNGFDAQVLELYRVYTRLHLRLFPYLWTYAKALAVDGRPIQRALGLAYPELGAHPNDVYLLGDHLLVAPIVDRGVVERDVSFPAEAFLDWWTGEERAGPGTLRVTAPLDVLPLFIRRGGIVPLLRPTIDTLSPVQDPDAIDSFATTAGVLYARVAPGPASRFELYDGSAIEQSDAEDAVTVSVESGSVFVHGFELETYLPTPPQQVLLDGAALPAAANRDALAQLEQGYLYVAEHGGLVVVRVPKGQRVVKILR